MSAIPWRELFDAADRARLKAYAPYSRFLVGAAIWSAEQQIFLGCNVENASYGLSVCAERHAIAALTLAGAKLCAVAIVVDSREPTPPCGVCRQVLAEFGSAETQVASRTVSGLETRWTLGQLLPFAFTRSFL